MSKPKVGVQLFTLRNFTKTAPDIAATLKKVAAMGTRVIQISGFGPVDPREVARMVADLGMDVAATHVAWPRFQNELDAVIEQHKIWNCRHPAIGSLPAEYNNADGVKRFLDELAPISARLAAAGMDFSYHNHHHELARYGGKTWLDTLYEQSSPALLKAEVDTHWIQAGGGDPAAWIRKLAGRQPLLHLKDFIITPERERRFAEIGEGNLNWPAILAAAEAAGVEYMLVEQDDCYGKDPFEALATSLANLRAWGYT